MLPPDFRDLLEEFARDGVEYVLVGGWAVAVGNAENLARAARALARFGAPASTVAAVGSMTDADVVFLGQPPLRVDFLRSIDARSTT